MPTFNNLKQQRGAILAFSLVMLLLLTLAGTRMIQQNKQQLAMANNARLLTQAFADAEAVLANAKNTINTNQAHDNYHLPDDNYFPTISKIQINGRSHECTPYKPNYKQNILLAGVVTGVTGATIIKVRCVADSGSEQVCSTYNEGVATCNGKTPCTSVIDAINQFNSSTDLCYQNYDPQCEEDLSTTTNPRCLTPPTPVNSTCTGKFVYKKVKESDGTYIDKCVPPDASCPKEVYTINVISNSADGTTREIISDHVVGCG
jgi:hypothetical protein